MQWMKAIGTVLVVLMSVPYAYAVDPMEKPDESWVSVNGTVVNPGSETFILDYGEGLITVEMDDWDWYGEANQLIDGDQVTVYGRIDHDFYEAKKIEADSVYVKGLNTFFYANDADEEDVAYTIVEYPVVTSYLTVTGTVSSVNGREFTLNTGDRKLKVDTIQMPYNPMDDMGFQKVQKGDRVRVSGPVEYDLFEKREIMANTVLTLKKDKTKKQGKGS